MKNLINSTQGKIILVYVCNYKNKASAWSQICQNQAKNWTSWPKNITIWHSCLSLYILYRASAILLHIPYNVFALLHNCMLQVTGHEFKMKSWRRTYDSLFLCVFLFCWKIISKKKYCKKMCSNILFEPKP